MPITISLSPKAEAHLKQQAAAKGRTLSAYATELIEQAVVGDNNAVMLTEPTNEQRSALWRGWVESHGPIDYVVDDSRDSIYAGRAE